MFASLPLLILGCVACCVGQEPPVATPEAPVIPVEAAADQQVVATDAPITACGATPNGGSVEQGRYTYVCKMGTLEPTGCLSDAKVKVAIGATFVRGIYEMKCVLMPDGHINVEYSACVYEGRVIAAGGTLDVGANWLSCDKQKDVVVQHISGCLHEGKRLKKGEQMRTADTLLQCRDQSPNPKVDQIGCVSGGKDFPIGQTITDPTIWYICTFENGKALKKAIGCVFNGQTQYDGQVYSDGVQLKQCRISNKTTEGAKAIAFGCVRPDGLKGFGCRFTDGPSPKRFLLECQNKGDVAAQVPINCVYEFGANDYYLDPNCYRVIGGQGVGCKKTPAGLDFFLFPQTEVSKAAAEGIKLC